jgi:hypothetical protein
MRLNFKTLKKILPFYKVKLEKEDLTERERDKYLWALKIIEEFIEKGG